MIEPKRAALIMIDMQNGFIDPSSSLCVAGAAATIPACARALAAARAAGMAVFHVRREYAPDGSGLRADVPYASKETIPTRLMPPICSNPPTAIAFW